MNNQIQKYSVPTLIRYKGKDVSSHRGVYSHAVSVAFAKKNKDRELTPEIIASVHFIAPDDDTIAWVRKRMWRINREVLMDRQPAYTAYDTNFRGRGRVRYLKVIGVPTEQDIDGFEIYCDKAEARTEVHTETFRMIKMGLKMARKLYRASTS